jgi:L-Ala-D/L-Glu epimerase
MKLRFHPYTLYFVHPFKIAHGVRNSTPVVITELCHEGITGFGEASMPPYLGESHDSVISFLTKASGILLNIRPPFDISGIMLMIDELAPGNTAAKASIDIALHDLKGKLEQVPCWRMFGAEKEKTPFSTFTLGIDRPEVLQQKVKEAKEFPILKVKLNGTDDKLIIETLRKITDKPIAVDVNQGWKTKEQALQMTEWLQERNVLFVEQPLPKNDHYAAHWLFERSALPLYADESVQRLSDLDGLKDCYHGINIKLMKCTGLNEASRMIKKGRMLGFKILIGCMSETSCAVSAAAQLSPFADHADLDGPLLIKNDLFNGIKFDEGRILLNDLPGIGVIRKGEG